VKEPSPFSETEGKLRLWESRVRPEIHHLRGPEDVLSMRLSKTTLGGEDMFNRDAQGTRRLREASLKSKITRNRFSPKNCDGKGNREHRDPTPHTL